jgi:hypothetical protein
MHQTNLFDLLAPPRSPLPPVQGVAWPAPAPDPAAYAYLASEGRAPFHCDGEGYDPVAMQATADETMNGLVDDLCAAAELDLLHEMGERAFRTRRAWAGFETDYPELRRERLASYEETLDAVLDVWGCSGRDAFDAEAKRRAGA